MTDPASRARGKAPITTVQRGMVESMALDRRWDAERNTTGEQQRLYFDEAAALESALETIDALTPQPAPEPVGAWTKVGLTNFLFERRVFGTIRESAELAEALISHGPFVDEMDTKEPPSAVLGGDAWTAGAKVMREAAAAYADRLGASATASLIQKMPIPTIPGQ